MAEEIAICARLFIIMLVVVANSVYKYFWILGFAECYNYRVYSRPTVLWTLLLKFLFDVYKSFF